MKEKVPICYSFATWAERGLIKIHSHNLRQNNFKLQSCMLYKKFHSVTISTINRSNTLYVDLLTSNHIVSALHLWPLWRSGGCPLRSRAFSLTKLLSASWSVWWSFGRGCFFPTSCMSLGKLIFRSQTPKSDWLLCYCLLFRVEQKNWVFSLNFQNLGPVFLHHSVCPWRPSLQFSFERHPFVICLPPEPRPSGV